MDTSVDSKSKKRLAPQSQVRINCPNCGNNRDFVEVADGVILSTHYIQNSDGSFSQDGDESQILGEIRLFCGECNTDLTQFHQYFLDMLF